MTQTKKYSAIHIPFLSFYSRDLYRDACFNWKGTGMLYMLVLVMICSLPSTIEMHYSFSKFCRVDAPKIVEQLPQITFDHGVASVEAPQPYSIKDPTTQKTVILIDTTGKVNSLHDTEAVVLVTKTEAMFRKNAMETTSYNYKNFDHFVLNKYKVSHWLEVARYFLAPVAYPFVVIGSYVYRILQLLLYAAIGLLFAALCNSKRSFDSLLRLAVIAVTPSIIVNTILGVAGVRLPVAGLWYFLASMAYLYLAVQECAKDFTFAVDDHTLTGNTDSSKIPGDSPEEKRF